MMHRRNSNASDGTTEARSDRYYRLGKLSNKELERELVRGSTPDVEELVGFEFAGMNTARLSHVARINKFVKGFYRRGTQVFGYNCPVVQGPADAPWNTKPNNDTPKRFGFFEVTPVDAEHRDNEYLHALLLDYSKGQNPRIDPSRGLRDYLVEVEHGLYLGKAYYALGDLRLPLVGFYFVLEKLRAGVSDLSNY